MISKLLPLLLLAFLAVQTTAESENANYEYVGIDYKAKSICNMIDVISNCKSNEKELNCFTNWCVNDCTILDTYTDNVYLSCVQDCHKFAETIYNSRLLFNKD